MGEMKQGAATLGRQAHAHDWMDHAIRLGLVAYGVVHLALAWVAVQLAIGDHSEQANSTGALQQLAQEPFGEALVWFIAVGMLLLVLWRVLEATVGADPDDGAKERVMAGVKAVIYAAIGLSAVQVATGSSSGGSGTDSLTSRLMDLPGGRLLVGIVGLVIVGYGVHHVVKAWTEKFRENLDAEGNGGRAAPAYVAFGKAGYTAKGVAVGVVGGLFCYAALTHEAKQSGGLDQALQTVLEQPFGPVLLVAVALGIACYGLFCFAQARHLNR